MSSVLNSHGDKTFEDIDEIDRRGDDEDPDAEIGGRDARIRMERKLIRKLDLRMCILIIIYILNYVSLCACARIRDIIL